MKEPTRHWSVASWSRYDVEPPTLPARAVTMPDGTSWTITEPVDPAWHATHVRRGAQIHDARRGMTFRATIDPATGDLDHLEVVVSGQPVDDRALARLGSVPLHRIRREVRAQVIAEDRARAEYGEGQYLVFTPVGGVPGVPGVPEASDGSRYAPPSSEELAALMAEHGWGRRELAAHYDRPVRTIDRWVRAARAELGDEAVPRQVVRRSHVRWVPKRPGPEGERDQQ